MTDNLFQIAATGGVVLTANKRLARQLVRRFDQQQLAAGLTVWPSPAILSLDAWLLRQLQQLGVAANLLTDPQAQRLWEEIVADDAAAAGRDLLQVPQAARRARAAHRLLNDYRTEFGTVAADEEHLAFLRWRQAWHARLAATGWLDRTELPELVATAVRDGRCAAPEIVILAGFDDLTPALEHLCATLRAAGCTVAPWETAAPPAPVQLAVHAAADMAEEVRNCARWARQFLERQPQAQLGVVVPQLADYQGLIERIFRAELDPSACLQAEDDPAAFSFSLGTPLAREGVVRAALRLLAVGDPVRLDDIGWLLRSPYLGGAATEGGARAAADRMLRRRGRSEWRLPSLAKALATTPRMAAVVTLLHNAAQPSRRRTPGAWAEHFTELLQRCGWPGERGTGSREFQAIRHLQEAFVQLAALDRVAAPLVRGEALAILNRLASETIFQPEAAEGRIQVLGTLEASGFSFDALWLLGLHDGVFPPPPRPNPFIPLAVQSRLAMPHADADRERDFAERLARRLFAAAPTVVASWPTQLDAAAKRPSPLLRGLPAAQLELAPSCDPFHATRLAAVTLETLIDERGRALPTDRPCSGGTRILTDQALCPFRAFAHHRLRAEGLEEPDLGIDSLARGSLVHGVLERFWQQVRSHAALQTLTAAAQTELLTLAAEAALQQLERERRCDLPARLRALEQRRLVAVAATWLAVERRRPPFRVTALEQRHLARVGRLQLRTRIDRIDALADGRLAVIDYKTGLPDPGQWLDPRVTEPQLPLYCLDLADDQIAAVLFAVVRARDRECTFKGVARDPDDWPRLGAQTQQKLLAERGWSDFAAILAHWRVALPALGDSFLDGWAKVDPVDPVKACQHCDLATLCRISEVNGLGSEPAGGTNAD
jgi:ATP-dependent helicase/nuclease subunit B